MKLKDLSKKMQKRETEKRDEYLDLKEKAQYLYYLESRYPGHFQVDSDIVISNHHMWREKLVEQLQKQKEKHLL